MTDGPVDSANVHYRAISAALSNQRGAESNKAYMMATASKRPIQTPLWCVWGRLCVQRMYSWLSVDQLLPAVGCIGKIKVSLYNSRQSITDVLSFRRKAHSVVKVLKYYYTDHKKSCQVL